MEKRMLEGSSSLVDNATQFDKSLKELRDFSSQLYYAADYCRTAFLNSQDKNLIVETTKEYVSLAVVTVIDHLGGISANLECCISKTNSIPELELKLDILKQRIGTCQDYSHKLALARFHWSAQFSRYHCRYISLPLISPAVTSVVSRDSKSPLDTKSGEGNQFETKKLQLVDTYNRNTSLIESNTTIDFKNVLPVHDGLSTLPKTEHQNFQFQESQKLKRSTINWKRVQKKDIASLIRRGKQILT